jgi:hypothetical protein
MKNTFVLAILFLLHFHSFSQCGFNTNVPTYFGVVRPQVQDGNPQLLGYPDVGTYFQMNVIKGLNYQVYLNRDNLSSQLRLDIYDEATQQWLAGSASNAGNPSLPLYDYNAYINWQSTISGTIRINISDAADCSSTNPHGLPATIKVSGSNTQDDANARGITDFTGTSLQGTWIEHLYDEPALTGSSSPVFNQYIGYNIIPASNTGFEQTFNSAGNLDSYAYPVLSNGVVRAGVLTYTFSGRYKTAMTICGSYRFRIYSDDGARAYVNGSLVIEDWLDHGAGYTGWYTINNYCGTVNIDLEYYDNSGDNVIHFEMEKLGTIADAISPVINNGTPLPNQQIAGTGTSFTMPDLRPLVRSVSTDNITPVVNLRINQSIAAGTIISTPFADVTADVQDLNSNTSTTVIRVVNINFNSLPLRLLSFSGVRDQDNIQFKWQTADEVNVSHFEIMQSSDGHHFSPVFKTPATKAGNYSTVIRSESAKMFYFLRATDIDGTFTQSQVITVPGYNTASAFAYQVTRSGSMYQIANKGSYKGPVKFDIMSTSGAVIQSGTFRLSAGSSQVLAPANSSGIVLVRLVSTDGKFSETYKVR